MNKADTKRGRTKKKRKGKSLDSFQQGGNLRRLLTKGRNKMDIDADKTKVLLQHYVRLGGPKELC